MLENPTHSSERTVSRRFIFRVTGAATGLAIASQIPEIVVPQTAEAANQASTSVTKKNTMQNAETAANWVRPSDRDLAQYGAYNKPGLVSPVVVAEKFDRIYKNVYGVLGSAAEYEKGLVLPENWQGKCPGAANRDILRLPYPVWLESITYAGVTLTRNDLLVLGAMRFEYLMQHPIRSNHHTIITENGRPFVANAAIGNQVWASIYYRVESNNQYFYGTNFGSGDKRVHISELSSAYFPNSEYRIDPKFEDRNQFLIDNSELVDAILDSY